MKELRECCNRKMAESLDSDPVDMELVFLEYRSLLDQRVRKKNKFYHIFLNENSY